MLLIFSQPLLSLFETLGFEELGQLVSQFRGLYQISAQHNLQYARKTRIPGSGGLTLPLELFLEDLVNLLIFLQNLSM